jgi:vacuolar-type H+-ATPase subunit H
MNQPVELLSRISEAEKAAESLVSKARQKARAAGATASEKANEILKTGREKAELRAKSIVKKAHLDVTEYAALLADQSKKEREKLESALARRMIKVVQFVLTEFKKSYGNR